jgi:hypothetical protein
MEEQWTVYKHQNKINNKVYVGITSQNPSMRWKNGWGYYDHNKYFFDDIKKFGWNDGFSHEILFDSLILKEAKDIEVDLIKKFDSTNPKFGYNNHPGGYNERKIKIKLTPIIIVNTETWELEYFDSIKYFLRKYNIKSAISSSIKKKALIQSKFLLFYLKDIINLNKDEIIKKSKIILKTKRSRTGVILQYDLNGNLINEFKSIIDASRKTGIVQTSIGAVCNGKFKNTHGFIFIRKRDLENKNIFLKKANKNIVAFNKKGEKIFVFKTRKEAALALKTTDSYIWELIKDNKEYKKYKLKLFKENDLDIEKKLKEYCS